MNSSSNGLSGLLYELTEDLLELVEQDSEFKPVQVEVPQVNADLEYSPGSFRLERSQETKRQTVWPQQTLTEIIEESSELDSYERVVELLDERIDNSPEYILNQFLRAVLMEARPDIEDRTIVNLISIFESDIGNSPIYWHPIAFLQGIHIETSEIELEDGVKIRQPLETDFEHQSNKFPQRTSPFQINPPRQEGEFPRPPTCVLEFSTRTSSSSDVTNIIEQHIVLLQLFEVGDVFISEIAYNPETILSRGYSKAETRPNDNRTGTLTYTLEEEDVDEFKDFVNMLADQVMNRLITEQSDTALTIAYDRYENALDTRQSPERRLTSVIMCLEALFLKEQERGELSERLSRRAGILLNQYGYQPNKVSREIREAYHIRSQYVHGSKLENDQSAGDFLDNILEYARRSIITFLQLEEGSGKESLLSKVESLSINPEALDSLESFIEDECQI